MPMAIREDLVTDKIRSKAKLLTKIPCPVHIRDDGTVLADSKRMMVNVIYVSPDFDVGFYIDVKDGHVRSIPITIDF